jgi:hypothetical protein
MEAMMKVATSLFLLWIGGVVLGSISAAPATPSAGHADQAVALDRALGKWHSTERFEAEPRITVALRGSDHSVEGLAVMLGQHRKSDDRATLALSFCSATWDGQRFLFSTVLPDDEGTIGWELRVTTPTTAVLKALTEDGQPIQAELRWDMTRSRIGSA